MSPLEVGWWRRQVVRPALQEIQLWSESAEILLTGTAIAESRLTWQRQIGGGPALGPYQIEPRTHQSLWADLLAYRSDLSGRILRMLGRSPADAPHTHEGWADWARLQQDSLVYHRGVESIAEGWWYATAIARCRYLWDRDPLPDADDVRGLAETYKRAYNTIHGAATVAGSIPHMERARLS